MIVRPSIESSTERSSAFGASATPCTEASALKSTKSWPRTRPRTGEAAVTNTTTLEVTVLDVVDNGKPLAIVDSSIEAHMLDLLTYQLSARVSPDSGPHQYMVCGNSCLAGDIFGEMALLENKPRSASAIAYEDAYLLAVNKQNFERMVQAQPQIVTRLTQLLAERIWFIYKQLANTLISDPLGRMYDALHIQLEKNRIPIKNGATHAFDFGPKDLINMVGLPISEGNQVVQQLLSNKMFRLIDNKIVVQDMSEIVKQAEYYRKMQKIERARKESQAAR